MLTRLCLVPFIVSIVMMALTNRAGSDEISDCNSPDPVRQVTGCSKLIARDEFDNEMLSFIYQNRAIAFFMKGKTERALADFTTAIRLNPKNDMAYQNRGKANLELGRLYEAMHDLDLALALNPDSAKSLANRGLVWLLEGQYGEALDDLNRSIVLNPASPNALNSRGAVFEKMGMIDRAIRDYQMALEIDPGLAIARINLNRLGRGV